MKKTERLNYKIMLSANGIALFALQLIGPFFVLFINQKGGSIENLGLLFGVSLLASSVTSYLIGRITDKIGRKPFLILSEFMAGVLIIFYLYIQNLPQLYALQIAGGINSAIWGISEASFMADITSKKTRGKSWGFYSMVLGIISAIGLMLGGFAIGKFGFKFMFWVVAIMSFVSTIILFFIKEKKKMMEIRHLNKKDSSLWKSLLRKKPWEEKESDLGEKN